MDHFLDGKAGVLGGRGSDRRHKADLFNSLS
jgi:hypothetical protein